MASPLGLTGTITTAKYNQESGRYNSIINDSKFYYRPPSNGGKIPTTSTSIHRPSDLDDVYDIKTTSIIDYTNKDGHEAMSLKDTDFAYLRDLGVYPNNRLIIARRFSTPVANDLTTIKHKPISTIVGWTKDNDSFGIKDLSFNEGWTRGEASLSKIMSEMTGSESGGKTEAGKGTSGVAGTIKEVASSIVPLDGFTRGFQYKLLEQMGLRDQTDNIPDGSPNYVQESSMREVIDSESNGSPLKSNWSVELSTVYEQKFINGNDPTLAFLDILGNLLRFGTSKSEFFINGEGGDTMKKFLKDFEDGKWLAAMKIIIDVVTKALVSAAADVAKAAKEAAGNPTKAATDIASTIGDSIISKYKVRIGSVISAWSGMASAPWHVTIGNPKKPFFSSGDMICKKVGLKFGGVLGFNDLPSTIEVSVTLEPARNLGLQEIFERFNTGAGRSYITLSDSFESDSPNSYWNNWWGKNQPKDPINKGNDNLSDDSTKSESDKVAEEKETKEFEK